MAYPLMSASGPATRHRRTASYPAPRAIVGPGLLPPGPPAAAPGAAPVLPVTGPPARAPPAVELPAGAAGSPSAPRRPPALGSGITMGGFGASARLAATTAFTFATRVVNGTDILASVSVAWC